jgi:hypothetical protein
LVADEVLVPVAILLLAVGIGADHQIQRAPGPLAMPGPARIQAPVAAVQVDHPAGMQGIGLGSRRDGQVLLHAALAGVAHGAPRMGAGGAGEDQPGLGLAHRFARVVLARHGGGLARVLA